MIEKAPEELGEVEQRLAESRRGVEEQVAGMRRALHSDLGIVPRTTAWVLPGVGFAVGFGMAVLAFRRRRALRG
jgi:uncharacterized iron-regulated membrane protein